MIFGMVALLLSVSFAAAACESRLIAGDDQLILETFHTERHYTFENARFTASERPPLISIDGEAFSVLQWRTTDENVGAQITHYVQAFRLQRIEVSYRVGVTGYFKWHREDVVSGVPARYPVFVIVGFRPRGIQD